MNYRCDALKLLEERWPDGDALVRSYDAYGRASGIALGADYAVGCGYDAFGRFSTVAVSNGPTFTYTYLPGTSLLAGYTNTLGLSVAYAYEPHRDHKILVSNAWGTNVISTFAYTYDEVGRRTQRIDDSTTTNLFGYNLRSELVSAEMGTNTYSYAYDPIGNRLSSTENGTTTTYAANSLNQYTALNPASTNPTPFTYDADGNMTQYGDLAFFWDAENRLLGVASNGIALVTNRYDYMSRRIEKGSAAGTNTFLYDGWNLIRENTTSSPFAVEIENPDFADGLAGWTSSNVVSGTCGSQSVAKFTTAGAWLEQDIGAVVGDEYLVTFRYHPSGCGGAPGYGSYPWNIAVSIGDATASTNGSYAPWTTWNGMSNFTFRLRPSTPAPLRIAVGGIPNPVVTHVSVAHVHHSSNSYVWGLDLSGILQCAGGIGGLLMHCHSDSESPHFSVCDANGNITDLFEEPGLNVIHYEYDSYGNPAGLSADFLPDESFCFSSKYWDGKTGLHYYGYRFHSSGLGRWLNRDLVAEYGGVNLYVFCDDNPIDFTDPYALWSFLPDIDFPVEGILGVAWAVLLNNPEITLTEDVLGLIRSDSDMLRYDQEIEEAVMAAVFQYSRPDTITVQCTNFNILKQGRVTFGGTRAPENMWEQLQGFWRPEYRATWSVGANPLTWLLRHADVQANTEVNLCFNCVEYAGTYSTEYKLSDTLDLRPHNHGNHEFELLLNPKKILTMRRLFSWARFGMISLDAGTTWKS